MGGGLAFLNKKTWHPGRMQNLEEVWKREQKAAAEQKKLEELRKQYEEERKNQEMFQIAEDAGHIKKAERLDWMYGGGLAAKQDAAKRAEEHLLGKPTMLQEQQADVSRCEASSLLPSFYSAATPASQNETWQRLNNDPLLAIRRQQQEQVKRIKENPIKMQEIIKEVVAVRKSKDERKREKKKAKKKHEKEKKKSHQHTGDGAASSDSNSSREDRGAPCSHGQHAPIAVAHHHPPAARHRPTDAHHAPTADRKRPVSRSRSRSRSPKRHHRETSPGPSHRDRHHADGGCRRPRHHDSGSHHAKDHQCHDNGGDRDHDRDFDRGHRHHDHHRHHHHDAADGAAGKAEDAGAARDKRYGLAHNTAAPEAVRQHDTTQRVADTRARLEEAARRKAAEEAEKARQRHQRREYKAGQLSAEEREKRLAEMMSNAEQHNTQRLERLRQAREADTASDAGIVVNANGVSGRQGDAFLQAATRDVYSAMGAAATSIEARITSRKHFHER